MTYIGEVTFNSRTLKQRFLTPQNAKSSSSSVGARARGVGSGSRLSDAQDEKDLPVSHTCHPPTLVILSEAKDLLPRFVGVTLSEGVHLSLV